jgi:hypothetical protein
VNSGSEDAVGVGVGPVRLPILKERSFGMSEVLSMSGSFAVMDCWRWMFCRRVLVVFVLWY